MATFRIKVTELHSDYVWITAETEEQALYEAHGTSECMFEALYDCEVVSRDEHPPEVVKD